MTESATTWGNEEAIIWLLLRILLLEDGDGCLCLIVVSSIADAILQFGQSSSIALLAYDGGIEGKGNGFQDPNWELVGLLARRQTTPST